MAINLDGVGTYNFDKLKKTFARLERDLINISALPGTLTVSFDDLETEDACAAIFEHCLPYKFDRGWWEGLRGENIQIDLRALTIRYLQNKERIESMKRAGKQQLRALVRSGAI